MMRSRARRRGVVASALCIGIGIALASTGVSAHEVGTTRVSVVFQEDRTYDIEIAADATALVEKLEATAGRPMPADTSPPKLQAILTRFDATFRQRVKIAFNESEVRPTIAYTVVPPVDASSATAAIIRLTGEVPKDARQFTWTYAWTFTSYPLTVGSAEAEPPVSQTLEGDQTSAPFTVSLPSAHRLRTAWRYLRLGFTHIVPNGLDHMLFVVGIYLLSRRARSVFWQLGAFTVAHSIALVLTMYGVLTLSPRIVEPLIALSIAYVAIENLVLSELKSWRVALVFAFGLLHGMGLAAALREIGLPRSEFVTALFTFNAGVELGQLAIVGAAFALVGWHCANRAWYRDHVVLPGSTLIACTAVYWTIVRVAF
jgi:hydrogenase/urease accessory protein HupE